MWSATTQSYSPPTLPPLNNHRRGLACQLSLTKSSLDYTVSVAGHPHLSWVCTPTSPSMPNYSRAGWYRSARLRHQDPRPDSADGRTTAQHSVAFAGETPRPARVPRGGGRACCVEPGYVGGRVRALGRYCHASSGLAKDREVEWWCGVSCEVAEIVLQAWEVSFSSLIRNMSCVFVTCAD